MIEQSLLVEKHVAFLKSLLNEEFGGRSPSFAVESMQHLKMSALYWALTALILLLEKLNRPLLDQLLPDNMTLLKFLRGCFHARIGGFSGNVGCHDAHLLFTLSAVQVLCIIKWRGLTPEDTAYLESWWQGEQVIEYILSMQKEDGSVTGDEFGEVDTRFAYCLVATLSLLKKLKTFPESVLSTMDVAYKKTGHYLMSNCLNFDGGFGAIPGSESHGGNIFCVVSSLAIIEAELGATLLSESARKKLLEYLVWRQVAGGGLNGRPEKLPDVCYSWWNLSAIKQLNDNKSLLIDARALQEFILASQDPIQGGIADRPGDCGDVFHTLFGVAGLSFLREELGKKAEDLVVGEIDAAYCLPKSVLLPL